MNWIPLKDKIPQEGAWVLMYLTKYMGVDKYRAGLYMGQNDWMSTANWLEPGGLLKDTDISHWMPLPNPPISEEKK